MGSAFSQVKSTTQMQRPDHIARSKHSSLNEKTKQSITTVFLTCESTFIDTVNLVVVQLEDAKVGKTSDTVRWNTGDLIVR